MSEITFTLMPVEDLFRANLAIMSKAELIDYAQQLKSRFAEDRRWRERYEPLVNGLRLAIREEME